MEKNKNNNKEKSSIMLLEEYIEFINGNLNLLCKIFGNKFEEMEPFVKFLNSQKEIFIDMKGI